MDYEDLGTIGDALDENAMKWVRLLVIFLDAESCETYSGFTGRRQ
jgi:hypothetical protein